MARNLQDFPLSRTERELPVIRLRLLQALEAVVSTGSVTRAASAIGVTQPAMSRMIAELEADVGCRMFNRQRGRFELTAQGHRFYDEAVTALAAIREVDHLAQELRADDKRRVRVIVMPGLPPGIVARAIASFAPLHPSVKVTVQSSYRTAMEGAIAAGQFDFALATLPISVPAARITPLATLPAVCLVPRDQRFAAHPVIRPEHLRDVSFVSQARDALVRRSVDLLFDRLAIKRRMDYEVQDGEGLIEMVAAGNGVAITHPLFHRPLPDNVAMRGFEPAIPIEYALLRPRALAREGWMQCFGRLLESHARAAILGAGIQNRERQSDRPFERTPNGALHADRSLM
jgi:DNA-binding transcriptional LysR family regulator